MDQTDWPDGLDLGNFDAFAWSYANADALFPSVELTSGVEASGWDSAGPAATSIGELPSLRRELATGRVAALTILHHGQLAYRWGDGTAPRLLMSVSKVMTSLALGRLIDDQRVDPTVDIRDIVPDLPSRWAGCQVRHVWDMASGVECPEVTDPAAYTDPRHPFYAFEASLGWRPAQQAMSPYELVCQFGRSGVPGSRYEYTSINTFLLAWVIERSTGRGYVDALQQLLWGDLALATPARICVNDAAVAVAHGGIVMSVDDLARIGGALTPSAGVLGHRWSVSDRYLELVRDPRPSMDISQARGLAPGTHPGCQWNAVRPDGSMFKRGFGGQGLYVDPARDIVIAYAGAPDEGGQIHGLVELCPRLARTVSADWLPLTPTRSGGAALIARVGEQLGEGTVRRARPARHVRLTPPARTCRPATGSHRAGDARAVPSPAIRPGEPSAS